MGFRVWGLGFRVWDLSILRSTSVRKRQLQRVAAMVYNTDENRDNMQSQM